MRWGRRDLRALARGAGNAVRSGAVNENACRPLEGLKVLELTHMVMGPACGLMLADLGADVVKVEPAGGDPTRRLPGSGAGFFPMYNRNKRSICLNLKSPEGMEAALKLADRSDVLVQNFRPGAMARLGLDYETLSARNPRLIYCTEKGFQAGPYENRAALDEVAQMMGGLAYMTGPPGRPLRAGASVIDVQGGMFGALGILAALHERERSGRGCEVVATLYESAVFLVGQHMAQKAVTGTAATPMPARVSAWAVYEAFETSTGEQVFVGVVSDVQWVRFCEVFGLHDLGSNPNLKKNADRVARRAEFIPKLKAAFAAMTPAELIALCSEAGLPFAPITRPEDLFDDAHLTASGGLLEVTMPDGEFTGGKAALPALPVAIGGARPALYRDVPQAGQHTEEILAEIGLG